MHPAERSANERYRRPTAFPTLCPQEGSRPARDCLRLHLHRGSYNRAAVCCWRQRALRPPAQCWGADWERVRLPVASAECSAPACRDAVRASATTAPEQGSAGRAAAEGMSQLWCHEGPRTAVCGEPRVPSSIQLLSHANDCQHETEAVKGKKITP